jgi:hypothetical protein
MKKYLFLFSTLFIFFANACKEKEPTLSIKTMSSVLKDMHIAEAYAQHMKKDSTNPTIKNADSLFVYNAEILEKHHLNEKEFYKNIDWYKNHPELLDSIYQNILTEIAIYQTSMK